MGARKLGYNTIDSTFRRALSTTHGLLPSDYRDQRPEHRAHAVRGHRGRRPLSLKKRRSVRGSPCAPEAPAAPRSAAPRPGHLPRPARCPPHPAPRRLRDPVSAARRPPPAGLIMTVKHHAHGQNELFRPGLLPSRSPPGQEERQVSFPGGEQPSRRPARSGAPRAAGWVRVRWLPGAPRAPSRRGDRSEAIG